MKAWIICHSDDGVTDIQSVFLNKQFAEDKLKELNDAGVDWYEIIEAPINETVEQPVKGYFVGIILDMPCNGDKVRPKARLFGKLFKKHSTYCEEKYGLPDIEHLRLITSPSVWIPAKTEQEARNRAEQIRLDYLQKIKDAGFEILKIEGDLTGSYKACFFRIIDPKIGNVDPGRK